MDTTTLIIMGVLLLILLLWVMREIGAWYTKVNERIRLLEENNMYLKKIAEHLVKPDKKGAAND